MGGQRTIFYADILVKHALVGQLCTHRGHPVDGSIEDDEAVELLGRLNLAEL